MINDKLFVVFGGIAQSFFYIAPAEFKTFLSTNFSDIPTLFLSDSKRHWYHNGLDVWNSDTSQWDRVSSNIDESVDYLSNIITNYNNVYFIGVSSGGYAAILHAYLINKPNISKILTYIPQTDLSNPFDAPIEQEINRENLNSKYLDLSNLELNDLDITIHGDNSSNIDASLHHIKHCTNMQKFTNTKIIDHSNLNMKSYRDEGSLLNDFMALLS